MKFRFISHGEIFTDHLQIWRPDLIPMVTSKSSKFIITKNKVQIKLLKMSIMGIRKQVQRIQPSQLSPIITVFGGDQFSYFTILSENFGFLVKILAGSALRIPWRPFPKYYSDGKCKEPAILDEGPSITITVKINESKVSFTGTPHWKYGSGGNGWIDFGEAGHFEMSSDSEENTEPMRLDMLFSYSTGYLIPIIATLKKGYGKFAIVKLPFDKVADYQISEYQELSKQGATEKFLCIIQIMQLVENLHLPMLLETTNGLQVAGDYLESEWSKTNCKLLQYQIGSCTDREHTVTPANNLLQFQYMNYLEEISVKKKTLAAIAQTCCSSKIDLYDLKGQLQMERRIITLALIELVQRKILESKLQEHVSRYAIQISVKKFMHE